VLAAFQVSLDQRRPLRTFRFRNFGIAIAGQIGQHEARQLRVICGDRKQVDCACFSWRAADLGQPLALQQRIDEGGLAHVRAPDDGNFRERAGGKLFWTGATSDKLRLQDFHEMCHTDLACGSQPNDVATA